tara:strand:- start:7607 stop:8608 length:1002 start_codon:yes stop_codon:yes gene_type:complete
MSSKYFLVRSPFRVSLFGGGTDYPEYYSNHKGAVIGFSINKYIYLGGLLTNDYVDYKYKLSYSKLEMTENIKNIMHPSVREGMKYMKFKSPIDLSFQADLPASSGLGSSSSFSSGFLKLLAEIQGKKLSKDELSRKAINLDRNILKEDVGVQDHLHSTYGGINKFSFYKDKITRRSIRMTNKSLNLLESSMMLVHTGKKRQASSIAVEQIKKTKNNQIDSNLEEMFTMVNQAENILVDLNKNNLKELGSLLNSSWEIKKTLTTKISSRELDKIYKRGMKLGAYGGKLCGAGGGGFFLFLLPSHRKNSFRKSFGQKNCIDFRIDFSGSQSIFKG